MYLKYAFNKLDVLKILSCIFVFLTFTYFKETVEKTDFCSNYVLYSPVVCLRTKFTLKGYGVTRIPISAIGNDLSKIARK